MKSIVIIQQPFFFFFSPARSNPSDQALILQYAVFLTASSPEPGLFNSASDLTLSFSSFKRSDAATELRLQSVCFGGVAFSPCSLRYSSRTASSYSVGASMYWTGISDIVIIFINSSRLSTIAWLSLMMRLGDGKLESIDIFFLTSTSNARFVLASSSSSPPNASVPPPVMLSISLQTRSATSSCSSPKHLIATIIILNNRAVSAIGRVFCSPKCFLLCNARQHMPMSPPHICSYLCNPCRLLTNLFRFMRAM
mmetsp:Transcript_15397/g.35233  ORF Transcript_15397/g.35233 Transcript_15397/m.35233 type:complete len:253 (+) Transcript_15397:1939-2697(+)